mmetsp:Transcript_121487/g.349107  ORF Transcript_121487/g.349107 Transcript_121487/m.349107 type:complete len:113 (-) Transcript_121487:11-349(-)
MVSRMPVVTLAERGCGPEVLGMQVGCINLAAQQVLEVPASVLCVRPDLGESCVTHEALPVREADDGRGRSLGHLILDDVHDALPYVGHIRLASAEINADHDGLGYHGCTRRK